MSYVRCGLCASTVSVVLLAAHPGDAAPPNHPQVDSHTAATTALADSTLSPSAPDGGWPRAIQTASDAALVMYQPQVLSWKDQRHMVAIAALSYTPKGAAQAALGTARFESPTVVSLDTRLVQFLAAEVAQITFPSLGKAQAQEVLAEVKRAFPEHGVLGLDRVLAALARSEIGAAGVAIDTQAPPIYVSARPAILLQFDGPPLLNPIDGTSLAYVVNTNWDVLRDATTKQYYVRDDTHWLQSADLQGKWLPADHLPADFARLPQDENWKEVTSHVPGTKLDAKDVPLVFVSERPAELILLDGEPQYEPVSGTALWWVSNTDSDLFRMANADFYYLVSGRWFRGATLEGPWTFATATLPPDFQRIPVDHARASVRCTVPGTDEAIAALLLANVPQTARVDKQKLQAPTVKYQDDPQFAPVAGTSVSYATNCSSDVLRVGDLYYLCFQAVWFVSTGPAGPWQVVTSIPAAIYAIPSSSPVHHVTYVTVVDPDPFYPTFAYTAGYVGITVAFGCAMWGTGWYYPPYYYNPPLGPPIYYPWPRSYGCGALYNPWTGAYGGYQAAYGPYGGIARAATYNPYTGTYARGAMAWGPYGAQGAAQAYNPRTHTYAATRQGSNIYGSWGSSYVQRGDDWVRTQRVTNAAGDTRWHAEGSGGGSATGWHGPQGGGGIARKGDDVYAGKDGNVYRKTDDGWQAWQDGSWQEVDRAATPPKERDRSQTSPPPTARESGAARPPTGEREHSDTVDQLNRDAAARSQGERQSREYGRYTHSAKGTSQRTPSAHPGSTRPRGGRPR